MNFNRRGILVSKEVKFEEAIFETTTYFYGQKLCNIIFWAMRYLLSLIFEFQSSFQIPEFWFPTVFQFLRFYISSHDQLLCLFHYCTLEIEYLCILPHVRCHKM